MALLHTSTFAHLLLASLHHETRWRTSMAVNHWQEPLVSWSHIRLKVLGGLKGIADFPDFRNAPLQLVIDLTPYEEHAQVICIGLLQHSRVLPLVWKAMPGQEKWEQGLWECVG